MLIACCSRRITDVETNYAATDKEGLAVVFAMTRLRNYLLGRHFTLLTHCALCTWRTKLPNSPRLCRWALLLSEYDFSIVYINGRLHQDVDCLSRAPVPDVDEEMLLDKCLVALQITPDAQWKIQTEQDEEAAEHL